MMQTIHKLLLALAVTAATLAAQNPSFTGVVNAASGIPPGMPNYGIAQGSIFVIYGNNLGPSTIAVAQQPLPTTAGLAGTSITITVGSTTVTAPMYYTLSTQVAAVMPSNTPVGNGILTLTYNGNSGSTPVTVVQTNFGISNAPIGSGSAIAAVTFANYQYVGTTNTAKPGDTLILWGTGLGPTPSGGGDTGAAPFGNIGNAPLVFVGGIQSPSVTYWGRSPNTIPGLDQINFVVPQNAPQGCNVSIVVQTATPVIVSNGPTMSIASTDGATCSDPTQIIPLSYLSASSVKVMAVQLKQNVSTSFNGNSTTTTTNSSEQVDFFQFSQAQLVAQAPGINTEPTFGSCLTGFVAGNGSGGGAPSATYLNAGTSVTLTSPSANQITLTAQTQYSATGSSSTIPSGTWGFSNTGGPDVGPLNFSFTVPQQVTWTNETQLTTGPAIDRTQPLLITWTGGDANGYVDIVGGAQIGPAGSPTYTVYFDCASPTFPTSGGQQFTIPPSILMAMPTGANAFPSLQVSTVALPYTLTPSGTVPGFDAALDLSHFQASAPVAFK